MIRFHEELERLLEPIDSVQRYPGNAWEGDVEAIAESIRANGVYRPVYAQRSTGHILAGNHTWEALLSLNAHQVPVIWLDVDDAGARRIVLADNKIPQLGQYNDQALLELLQAAVETSAHEEARSSQQMLEGTGWQVAELNRLEHAAKQEPFSGDDFDRRESVRNHCPNCGWALGAATDE